MVSATPTKEEGPLPPPPVSPAGTYAVQDVRVGCKVYMTRPTNASGTQQETRLAEVLSIREKPNVGATPGATDSANGDSSASRIEFFVHWHLFNKRLDEWVSATRVQLNRDMEWPRPKADPAAAAGTSGATSPLPSPSPVKKASGTLGVTKVGTVGRSMSLLKKATLTAASQASSSSAIGTKRKLPPDEQDEEDEKSPKAESPAAMDLDEDEEEEVSTPLDPSAATIHFSSKSDEVEKLRHSGSMTQAVGEVARVKNLDRIQIGRAEVEAWYFSPYPIEYAHLPVIFLCEFCLAYYPSQFMLGRHRKSCTLVHPPGNEIYRHKDDTEEISFFEIDGKRQVTWCRNLSLLSKCFLDHKTLYFDVQPFLYYVMTSNDEYGCHILGYFSKEKESAENYNVACILTLPQHQRKGYGKLLIEFSYELSKRESKLGSPEKPLSDLGLLGYKAYWMETIIEMLLNGSDDVSIEEIANRTSITQNDVMWTCQQMGLFKHYRNQHVICLTDQVKEQYHRVRAKARRRIVSENIVWKPPVFSREQLRFGY